MLATGNEAKPYTGVWNKARVKLPRFVENLYLVGLNSLFEVCKFLAGEDLQVIKPAVNLQYSQELTGCRRIVSSTKMRRSNK